MIQPALDRSASVRRSHVGAVDSWRWFAAALQHWSLKAFGGGAFARFWRPAVPEPCLAGDPRRTGWPRLVWQCGLHESLGIALIPPAPDTDRGW